MVTDTIKRQGLTGKIQQEAETLVRDRNWITFPVIMPGYPTALVQLQAPGDLILPDDRGRATVSPIYLAISYANTHRAPRDRYLPVMDASCKLLDCQHLVLP
eukprot:g33275.t1